MVGIVNCRKVNMGYMDLINFDDHEADRLFLQGFFPSVC